MINRSKAATQVLRTAHAAHTRAKSARAALVMVGLFAVAMLFHRLWPATALTMQLTPLMSGTVDFSNAAANYALDQLYDNKFPAGSSLRIRTGAVAGAENADSGTVVATVVTPASPWAAASGGTKAKSGTWQDSAADATGTAAHYRLTSTDTTMIEEGTVTATGGGGEMTVDNTSFAVNQVFTISTFSRSL